MTDLVLQEVPVPAADYNYWGRKSYVPPTPAPPAPPAEACSAYGAVAGFTCNNGVCVAGNGKETQVRVGLWLRLCLQSRGCPHTEIH